MSEIFKLKFQAELEGKEEFDKFFSSGERGARTMQGAIRGALADTAKDIKSFVAGIGRDLASASGIRLGIGANAKQVLEFRDSLQRLVIMAQVGDDQIAGLKQQILDVAKVSNQAAPAIEEALSAFVEKTGDIETARKNLALYAQTATATAAAIEDVAQVGVQLSDKLNVKDQAQAFAILATQAKVGAIELKDLATYAPRIFSSGAGAGLTGEKGVREAGALAQVYAKAFGGRGSAAMVSTAIENTFRDMQKNTGKIEASGIRVSGRDPLDVLFDIIRANHGDVGDIVRSKIFDARSMRGITVLANEFKGTGRFGTYESFRDVDPRAGLIASDAARAQSTGVAALQRTQNQIFEDTDKNIGDTAEGIAKHSGLIAQAYGFATAHPLLAASGGAGALLLANLAKHALIGGGFGGQGLVGKALGIGGGAVPVQVMNWPSGFGGGGGAAGAIGKSSGWFLAALGISAGEFAALAAPLAVAVGGLVYTQMKRGELVDKLATGTEEYNKKIENDASFRQAERDKFYSKVKGITRHRGGMVIAEPGGDLGQGLGGGNLIQNDIKVEIHGDEAKVTDGSGTRSTRAQVVRHGAGN